MARSNSVQFAVVREDAAVEAAAVRRVEPPSRVLCVASGGCTYLHLQALWPGCSFVLVDPNAAQLDLVERKIRALERGGSIRDELFNVDNDDPLGLSQCGNFESLFRSLRRFVAEFVADPMEIAGWFDADTRDVQALESAFQNPYWDCAFRLFFSDALLETMFTTAATQHAESGSYPDYFRRRVEAGLRADDAPANRFLHHIFLGCYRRDALPPFLSIPRPPAGYRCDLRAMSFQEVDSFAGFDLVALSNVMDWMDADQARQVAARVGDSLAPGAVVVWRQLNNSVDRRPWFGPRLSFDTELEAELTAMDRSLFYQSVHCGRAER